jgi:hypothetical protein
MGFLLRGSTRAARVALPKRWALTPKPIQLMRGFWRNLVPFLNLRRDL